MPQDDSTSEKIDTSSSDDATLRSNAPLSTSKPPGVGTNETLPTSKSPGASTSTGSPRKRPHVPSNDEQIQEKRQESPKKKRLDYKESASGEDSPDAKDFRKLKSPTKSPRRKSSPQRSPTKKLKSPLKSPRRVKSSPGKKSKSPLKSPRKLKSPSPRKKKVSISASNLAYGDLGHLADDDSAPETTAKKSRETCAATHKTSEKSLEAAGPSGSQNKAVTAMDVSGNEPFSVENMEVDASAFEGIRVPKQEPASEKSTTEDTDDQNKSPERERDASESENNIAEDIKAMKLNEDLGGKK